MAVGSYINESSAYANQSGYNCSLNRSRTFSYFLFIVFELEFGFYKLLMELDTGDLKVI